jgi:AraC-like DNA-binding protein
MKLYIKYMVSLRCKMTVQAALQQLGLLYTFIDLGIVELVEEISYSQREALKEILLQSELELMDDKKSLLIEKMTAVVIEMIHHNEQLPKVNYSEYISQKVGDDYTYLSNLFPEVKGTTLQQFIIFHKIERVKELILYDELTLTEIAYRLRYSSRSHLSNQFKKVTGLSPSFYKQIKYKRKANLEHL